RDIVLASHLKPLERKDKAAKKGTVLWNPCVTRAKREESSSVEIAQELHQLPGTSAEFYRDWRRCLKNGKEKYQFLLKLEGKALGRIFQADLGFGLLGEFLTVLAENMCHEDRAAVVQILQGLSSTKRFGLNLDLLSEAEKESGRDLFRKLQSMSTSGGSSGEPSGPTDRETEGEAQLLSSSLQKETEGEIVRELMKRYQV
ncbi:Coiled-coil domain-containing protein 103, partial [Tinamus guttatus]